eukprot:COSAG02_NODE_3019_length_7535_cov_9.178456_8_plen_420_part_00
MVPAVSGTAGASVMQDSMERIAPRSVSRTLHVAHMEYAQPMVNVTVMMDILGLLAQPCVATQRAASTAAAMNSAPASVMRDLMVNTVISAKRTSMGRSVTSSASGRLCAMTTAAVTSTGLVIAMMGSTVQAVSGSALPWSNATVMGIAIHAAFVTVRRDFMALHAQCTVGQTHAMATVSALMMDSVTAMMAIMERHASGSAEIPQRAVAMDTATELGSVSVVQVLQALTAINAAQITMGRLVIFTATAPLCATITVHAGQMQHATAMQDITEKLAVSSATTSRRVLAKGNVTQVVDADARQISMEMTAASSAQLAPVVMHLTAAAKRTGHVTALDILLAQNAMSVKSTSMVQTVKPTVANPQTAAFAVTVGRAVGTVCAMMRASASAMTTTAASFAMFVAVSFMARRASFIALTKSLSA